MDLFVSKWPCTLEAIGTEIWQIEPTETGIFLDDFFWVLSVAKTLVRRSYFQPNLNLFIDIFPCILEMEDIFLTSFSSF